MNFRLQQLKKKLEKNLKYHKNWQAETWKSCISFFGSSAVEQTWILML